MDALHFWLCNWITIKTVGKSLNVAAMSACLLDQYFPVNSISKKLAEPIQMDASIIYSVYFIFTSNFNCAVDFSIESTI